MADQTTPRTQQNAPVFLVLCSNWTKPKNADDLASRTVARNLCDHGVRVYVEVSKKKLKSACAMDPKIDFLGFDEHTGEYCDTPADVTHVIAYGQEARGRLTKRRCLDDSRGNAPWKGLCFAPYTTNDKARCKLVSFANDTRSELVIFNPDDVYFGCTEKMHESSPLLIHGRNLTVGDSPHIHTVKNLKSFDEKPGLRIDVYIANNGDDVLKTIMNVQHYVCGKISETPTFRIIVVHMDNDPSKTEELVKTAAKMIKEKFWKKNEIAAPMTSMQFDEQMIRAMFAANARNGNGIFVESEEPHSDAANLTFLAAEAGMPVLVPKDVSEIFDVMKDENSHLLKGFAYTSTEIGSIGTRMTYMFANTTNWNTANNNILKVSELMPKLRRMEINKFLKV